VNDSNGSGGCGGYLMDTKVPDKLSCLQNVLSETIARGFLRSEKLKDGNVGSIEK